MLKKLHITKRTSSILIILLLLFLLPVVVLFKEGFFASDDGEWMVIRFSAFYQTLHDGQFPPRFFGRLNHGFGYPIGNFLYPAFFYIATPLKLLGLSFVESIKAVFILSFLLSGIGSYAWLRKRFADVPAALGSIVYVYFPYHLYDLYIRGSIGELLAFAVLPFVLLAIDYKKTVVGSFLFALLILSHNSFALLLFPFLLFYTYLSGKRALFLIFPLGLLLSAYFWLPSIAELHYTIFSTVSISDWQGYFLTLDSLSLIGSIGIGLFAAACYILYKKKHTITLFFVVIYFLSLFFASPLSQVFWNIAILPKLVQFPWRFLILTVWSAAFLSAFAIQHTRGMRRNILILMTLILVGISAIPQLLTFRPVQRDEGYYYTNEDTTTVKSEYMPKTVTVVPLLHPNEKVQLMNGNASISAVSSDSYKTSFIIRARTPATVTVQTIYYPGWYATRNGVQLSVVPSKEGYVSLTVPVGESMIATEFGETPLRLLADFLSLGTAALLIMYLIIPGTGKASVVSGWYNKHLWKKRL